MDYRMIDQSFDGKRVRFIRSELEIALEPRVLALSRGPSATNRPLTHKFKFETWAIPLQDFCSALSIEKTSVKVVIKRNHAAYLGLHTLMPVPDGDGSRRRTTVIVPEMATAIAARLAAGGQLDDEAVTRIADFQRWLIYIGGLIRQGKLQAVSQNTMRVLAVPDGYRDLVCMRSGRELARRVTALADAEGLSKEHVYRLLRRLRGGNVITKSGVSRKKRSVK